MNEYNHVFSTVKNWGEVFSFFESYVKLKEDKFQQQKGGSDVAYQYRYPWGSTRFWWRSHWSLVLSLGLSWGKANWKAFSKAFLWWSNCPFAPLRRCDGGSFFFSARGQPRGKEETPVATGRRKESKGEIIYDCAFSFTSLLFSFWRVLYRTNKGKW